MKYILALSVVTVLVLSSCFERQEPAPIAPEQEVMIEDDSMMNDDEAMPEEDDMMMPEDEAMPEEDDMMMDAEADLEVEASLEEDDLDEIEESLEDIFRDLLGE